MSLKQFYEVGKVGTIRGQMAEVILCSSLLNSSLVHLGTKSSYFWASENPNYAGSSIKYKYLKEKEKLFKLNFNESTIQ